LVEKFVDALVWVVVPVYLTNRGLSLSQVGVVVGVYGLTWGLSQLVTGRLSDRVGRHRLNVGGMLVCGAGVAWLPIGHDLGTWAAAAALAGLGMAMLYPNLSAAVADIAAPAWRGTAIGVYRFWRDLGYAVGAWVVGAVAQLSGGVESTFGVVAMAMLLSALVLARWGEETHPQPRSTQARRRPGAAT
jgi:MFS family permease